MISFKKALRKKLLQSYFNDFGTDNYDEPRFGETYHYHEPIPVPYKKIIRSLIKFTGYRKKRKLFRHKEFIEKYELGLQRLYERLSKKGQELLVSIIAYRLLGYKQVMLSRNNKEYWDAIETGNSLVDKKDTYDPHFMHFVLEKYDLRKIGFDIQLYFSGAGVAIDFILEQYAYKSGGKRIVSVEQGDVVLDLGACWGDTALYFAANTGEEGKVYSFEFIPDNIKIFNINISLNPNLKNQVELIKQPVSAKSGEVIYFVDNGPGSRIEYEPFEGQTDHAITVSIDDFVKKNNIEKVDFIKMDIEGAEPAALNGAIETIKKFKPKLAIAIYHSMEDLVNIPQWITELNLGYNLYLDHFTIHSEETVIFAKVE
jgi:FkbM family methyltransferase